MSLTEAQITDLSAYLSSPGLIPARSASPTRAEINAEPVAAADQAIPPPSQRAQASSDPLRSIKIEGDLRRDMLANIAHHRAIGTYRGRRHANGFPVRGQRTQRNALTARRLNRLERRQFSTATGLDREQSGQHTLWEILAPLAHARFRQSD